MRAHSTADVIGNNINSYYDELDHDSEYYANYSSEFIAMEWVVTDRINAQTGQNFSSWAEYFGPRLQHDASFTLTQQYNLSDGVFNNDNLAINFPEDSFEPSTPDQDFPWRAEDIVIVSATSLPCKDPANIDIAYRWPMLVRMRFLRGTDDPAKGRTHRCSRRPTRTRSNASRQRHSWCSLILWRLSRCGHRPRSGY